MTAYNLAKFIVSHPLNREAPIRALTRFAKWQVASRLMSRPIALPFVNSTALVTEAGMTGATGNWYCGLHEVDEMGFVLHMLREKSLFMDVGVNIGSYTVLAAGAVGADVIAVEPVPSTFSRLSANIGYNNISKRVQAYCCGLSSEIGELTFMSELDTMNRVALPNEAGATIKVPVKTLDSLVQDRVPEVIKIDVEGHEAAVLRGAQRVLASSALQAVLMETNESGAKFGVRDSQLVETMKDFGFTACSYDGLKRELRPSVKSDTNTIFVRNLEDAQARCSAGPRYTLINGTI